MLPDDLLSPTCAIRTLEAKGTSLYCWGGGGITASSEWEAEYQETLDKVGPIMAALEEKAGGLDGGGEGEAEGGGGGGDAEGGGEGALGQAAVT